MFFNNSEKMDFDKIIKGLKIVKATLREFSDKGNEKIAIHCKTKDEAIKLIVLTNSNFSYVELWETNGSNTCYNISEKSCSICNITHCSNIKSCESYKIIEFTELEEKINEALSNLFEKSDHKEDIKVGYIVEDITHDMYGIVMDEISEEEVYVYTDNMCIEKWEKENLVWTGEKADLSSLRLERPDYEMESL